MITRRVTYPLLASLFFLLLNACGGQGTPADSAEAPAAAAGAAGASAAASSTADWQTALVSTPGLSPELSMVVEIAATPLPIVSPEYAMDLLLIRSGRVRDYPGADPSAFYGEAQVMLGEVFGVQNALSVGSYGSPIHFYVTDGSYKDPTPASGRVCFPGLPTSWVPDPQPIATAIDLPFFECNVALSTASVSLNLGFIVHRQPLSDTAQYNLFSSEYNSYAAVLHEFSHAALVLADEAETGKARWMPPTHPNIYDNSQCAGACPANISQCAPVDSTYYRCKPDDDDFNLMYFYPSPLPGVNANWQNYQYYFDAEKRRDHILGLCVGGNC